MFLKLFILIFGLSAKCDRVTFQNVTLWAAAGDKITEIQSSNELTDYLIGKPYDLVIITGKIPVLYEHSVADVQNVTHLHFFANKISEIQKGAFENLRGVKSLSVSYSNLTFLEKKSFDNLDIEELELEFGQLSTIHFGRLPKLATLSLRHNHIEELQNRVFDNAPRLQNLDLSFNLMKTLPEDIFENLSRLRSLLLKNNQLNNFPEVSSSLPVTYLDLSSNSIRELEPGALNKWPELASLNLAHNRLSKILGGVFSGRNLKRLILCNNQISSVASEAFDDMSQLFSLDLSKNRLTGYDPKWFYNARVLYKLNFAHNSIQNLRTGSFANLQKNTEHWLDLSNNQISKIESGAFPGLNRIRSLDLSYNEIENWDETMLESVDKMFRLNLFYNKINCPSGNFSKVFKARFTCLGFNRLSPRCLQKVVDFRKLKMGEEHNISTESCMLF